MASLHLVQPSLSFPYIHIHYSLPRLKFERNNKKVLHSQPQNIASTSSNGAFDSPEPIRRGRKKKPTSSSSSSTTIPPPPKKTKCSRNIQVKNATIEAKNRDPYLELYEIEDYDDGIEFPYDYPSWKMLQWDPVEFLRAPSAISHVRLGGCATFMGKVGKDEFGDELVLMMNKEKVPLGL